MSSSETLTSSSGMEQTESNSEPHEKPVIETVEIGCFGSEINSGIEEVIDEDELDDDLSDGSKTREEQKKKEEINQRKQKLADEVTRKIKEYNITKDEIDYGIDMFMRERLHDKINGMSVDEKEKVTTDETKKIIEKIASEYLSEELVLMGIAKAMERREASLTDEDRKKIRRAKLLKLAAEQRQNACNRRKGAISMKMQKQQVAELKELHRAQVERQAMEKIGEIKNLAEKLTENIDVSEIEDGEMQTDEHDEEPMPTHLGGKPNVEESKHPVKSKKVGGRRRKTKH